MNNLADIAGSNAIVNIGLIAQANGFPLGATARWVQVVATGAGIARLGGAQVSATVGLPVIANGGSQFLPAVSQGENPPPYNLNALNVYIPVGCTISIAYEPFN